MSNQVADQVARDRLYRQIKLLEEILEELKTLNERQERQERVE